MDLTVVVPIYNEEKHLRDSVINLVSTNVAKKIILVDDCSTDKSLMIAEKLCEQIENISLYKKNKNEGKGSCLNYVKDKITTSHLIVHDADLEQNPFDIIKMFELSKSNPNSLILGSRTTGKQKRNKMYKVLSLANYLLCKLFNILHKSNISDISSGYLLYSVEFFKSIIINENGFGIEVEIISKFIKNNENIIEVSIDYNGRTYTEGKKIKIYDGINILYKIFKYKFI